MCVCVCVWGEGARNRRASTDAFCTGFRIRYLEAADVSENLSVFEQDAANFSLDADPSTYLADWMRTREANGDGSGGGVTASSTVVSQVQCSVPSPLKCIARLGATHLTALFWGWGGYGGRVWFSLTLYRNLWTFPGNKPVGTQQSPKEKPGHLPWLVKLKRFSKNFQEC